MTGDTHNNGESNLGSRADLGEDFVVEDLLLVEEGVDSGGGPRICDAAVAGAPVPAVADRELDPLSVGAPGALEGAEELLGSPPDDAEPVGAGSNAKLDDARGTFTDALDAMLRAEDDCAFDADAELDVVNADLSESGAAPEAFLLDEGDVSWGLSEDVGEDRERMAGGHLGDEPADVGPPAADEEHVVGAWFGADATVPNEATEDREGAAPDAGVIASDDGPTLDGRDARAHGAIDAAARGAVVRAGGFDAPAERGLGEREDLTPLAPLGSAEAAPEDVGGCEPCGVEGGDEVAVIGGPRQPKRRVLKVLVAAAAVLVLGVGAVVSTTQISPRGAEDSERAVVVRLPRPAVEVAVAAPSVVATPPVSVAAVVEPVVDRMQPGDRGGDSGSVVSDASPEPAEEPAPTLTLAQERLPVGKPASVAAPTGVSEALGHARAMSRFGEDLYVGGTEAASSYAKRVVEGELAGSRAFVQLHNGNSFVGRVKRIEEGAVTLRMASGELTLARAAVAVMTRLGSQEYEALQRATEGVVCLTNHNRIEGGVTSGAGGDHVILESQRSRVLLPRSAVGEVLAGGVEGAVRLRTTAEEDGWLREVAAKSLGDASRSADRGPTPSPGGRGR
jgi:hypothetical protein